MGRVGKEEDAFGICSLVQGWRQQFREQGSRLCSQSFWWLLGEMSLHVKRQRACVFSQ